MRLALAVLGIASTATAQPLNYFYLNVASKVSPANPITHVELWCAFDPAAYAYAGANLTLFGDPSGDFFNLYSPVVQGPCDPTPCEGIPSNGNVIMMKPGQLHFPPLMLYAKTDNPILVWTADWTTQDFTPRSITIRTESTQFFLYTDPLGTSASYLSSLQEASSLIHVIPAPATCLLLPVLTLRRRRYAPPESTYHRTP